jgi:VanZ family protein
MALFIIYLVTLTTATHIPKPPDMVRGVLVFDKLVHGAAYAILVGLGWLAWPPMPSSRRWTRAAVWLGLASVFAAADEILQPLTGRDAELGDWAADVIGVVLVLGLMATIDWRRSRKSE